MTQKPTAYQGQGYPYRDLTDRDFEKLLYQIFAKDIEKGLFEGRYDNVDLMPGVGERGRDSALYLKGEKVGVIQCKKHNQRLSKPDVAREVIKFVLHYLQDDSLISDPHNFTYYMAASSDFSEPALDLLSDFNNKIVDESQLEKWTRRVIGSHKAFEGLDFSAVEDGLRFVLRVIRVEKITPDMLNRKLATYPNLLPLFFEMKKVVVQPVATPLSKIPITARPLLDQVLVGRDAELSQLKSNEEDALLIGQYGSGKTFLLYKLALEEDALFVVSKDRGEVENALAIERPRILIVDDAHVDANYELLLNLKQIRAMSGAGFSLIASCWPGSEGRIAEALALPQSRVCRLELLTRDEIVAVVKNTGIHGPDGLIREIVNQAEGRPGLAVTLAQLCLEGDVKEVVLGDALTRSILNFFKPLFGPRGSLVLAGFSVGGDSGMPIQVVSEYLNMDRLALWEIVAQLDAGGVIQAVDKSTLAVRPEVLRHAMVRDTFFRGLTGGLTFLPIEPLLTKAPQLADAAGTLIGAKRRGADVPEGLLVGILERCGRDDLWREYSWLGSTEARAALAHRPEKVIGLAQPALNNVPEMAIPLLLDRAVGDERPLHSNPDHPLRLIEDWVSDAFPGTEQLVMRRRVLLEAVSSWLAKNGDPGVTLRTCPLIMFPSFRRHSMDPGSGRTLTITEGFLSKEELEAIEQLWPTVLGLVKSANVTNWEPLRRAVESWAYPTVGHQRIPADVYQELKAFAARMVTDIVLIAEERPGVRHWAYQVAKHLGAEIEVMLDSDFELLYPGRDLTEDWRAGLGRQTQAVRELAEEWIALDPNYVANRIEVIEREAESIDVRWPRLTGILCREIAEQTGHPLNWAQAMIDVGLGGDMVAPFLEKAAGANDVGWMELARTCLDRPELRGQTVSLILTMPQPPQGLVELALQRLEGLAQLLETHCLRGEISETLVGRLLRHKDGAIAFAAAKGEWSADPKEAVREALRADWERVVISHTGDAHWLSAVLRGIPALAQQWLLARVADEETIFWQHEDAFSAAVNALDMDARLYILDQVPDKYGLDEVLFYLIGDHLDLYREFLGRENLKLYHLVLLSGKPSDIWIEKAKLALNAGYSTREVALAAYTSPLTTFEWTGDESAMWAEWISAFAPLRSDEDERIQDIGKVGTEYALRRKERALSQERHEAIYGMR